jgi:hypothetical protein
MGRAYVLLCLVSLAFGRSHAGIGQTNLPVAANPGDEALIQRIQVGDIKAIVEAGKSGKQLFVPYLRQKLNDSHSDVRPAATLALARLGETQQLQEYWCLALNEDPDKGQSTPLIFEQIGGWFSIQALEKFLPPEGELHWKRATDRYEAKHPGNDIQFPAPSYYALQTLPKVVPNPPAVGFTPAVISEVSERNREIKIWTDWIAGHKAELSKLEPTGEGVDFSDGACKNGKPRKKLG